jgi:hypothetical protein
MFQILVSFPDQDSAHQGKIASCVSEDHRDKHGKHNDVRISNSG